MSVNIRLMCSICSKLILELIFFSIDSFSYTIQSNWAFSLFSFLYSVSMYWYLALQMTPPPLTKGHSSTFDTTVATYVCPSYNVLIIANTKATSIMEIWQI